MESKPERRAVDLNEVVERTLALRAYVLKIENIKVDLDVAAGLPRILAYAAQLQQVALNLVVNAEQAIQQGRGRGRISIRTQRLAGDRVELEISDDGPGIPPEVISRIFDPFFTTKPAGVGTGLGLSIAYGIVHEHGGEISVESEPGLGAIVRLEFPALAGAAGHLAEYKEIPNSSPGIAVLPASPMTRGAARRQRILVLEDEPTVAQLIADVVSEEGHPVDTVLDSRDALSRLEEKNYDLIICDLKMPHLDGPGFYRALVRAANPLQHRLLFVTGDTMSPRTLEFLNSSGLPYLAKPFLVEELKQAVRHSLDATSAEEKSDAGAAWSRAIVRKK
jgi:CheY-like chemotaxis protein